MRESIGRYCRLCDEFYDYKDQLIIPEDPEYVDPFIPQNGMILLKEIMPELCIRHNRDQKLKEILK